MVLATCAVSSKRSNRSPKLPETNTGSSSSNAESSSSHSGRHSGQRAGVGIALKNSEGAVGTGASARSRRGSFSSKPERLSAHIVQDYERGNLHDHKANVRQDFIGLGFHAIGERHGCRTISTRRRGTTAAQYAKPTTPQNPNYRHHGTERQSG